MSVNCCLYPLENKVQTFAIRTNSPAFTEGSLLVFIDSFYKILITSPFLRWWTCGSVDASVKSSRKILMFRKMAIGSSLFQILVYQRFQRPKGSFNETIFRLIDCMVYVNSNILAEMSKISKTSFPLSTHNFFGKVSLFPGPNTYGWKLLW